MGIGLKKIFPKEFKELEQRNIDCDNLNKTDILEYMLLDYLGVLSELRDTPLRFMSFGYCYSQRLLTIVPPDFNVDFKPIFPIPNIAYTDDQRAKINLVLQRIEEKYPTGNIVETNRCDASSQYCPYVNFPTELYQKALQQNALMEATDEKHVQSLTKEAFDSLKNRVLAYVFLDNKQDVDLIAVINRILKKMDEIYSNKATHTQNSSVMFQPRQPEMESERTAAAAANCKLN